MEVFRNQTDAVVTLPVPTGVTVSPGSSIDIVAVENGIDIYEFPTVAAVPGVGFQVTLPWFLTRHDRDFFIDWSFTHTEPNGTVYDIKDRSYVQVITPLLTLEETAALSKIDLATARQDVINLERQVRYAVQTYTGQNFGKFAGAMRVSGNGSTRLSLPAPLLEFTGLAYDGVIRPIHGLEISNDGWVLSGGRVYIDSIKQAPPEWMLDNWDYTGVIRHPYSYGHNYFYDGVEYTVQGVWGYHDVPGDVRQAARILTDDYSCDESLWRDRYIDSVRAGDWRFEFNAQAFTGTGNVQADQILAGYRRATMVVV